jgi:hypothetical protein
MIRRGNLRYFRISNLHPLCRRRHVGLRWAPRRHYCAAAGGEAVLKRGSITGRCGLLWHWSLYRSVCGKKQAFDGDRQHRARFCPDGAEVVNFVPLKSSAVRDVYVC